MTDLELTTLNQVRDTAALNRYRMMTERLGQAPAEALIDVIASTRDRCRSPFQWSAGPNAGFSPAGVATWLPVNDDYAQGVNVADQTDRPDSILSFYRHLLHLRRTTPALHQGDYRVLDAEHADCLVFQRVDPESGSACVVALNFSDREQRVSVADRPLQPFEVLIQPLGVRP